jgi:hypothetical protein
MTDRRKVNENQFVSQEQNIKEDAGMSRSRLKRRTGKTNAAA